MALAIGSRIATYEITGPLGAGGMGEVYRARDTKLAREVALKILPAEFALDPERLARFTREAQVLASLNHPNIAAIYGFEDSDGPADAGRVVRALVLELVDGPTLADRIAQGRLPIDEALPIARQIAEALEAAHEQGIIHRDLKPANIKVRPDGTVKVLDFGLAKLIEGTDGPEVERYVPGDPNVRLQPDRTAAPTVTTPAMTMAGVILGTAAYISPEQAKGRTADKRSDIWAFGCVLFEMLTGRRAFDGEDVSDTLAAVLRAEPDWTALPTNTPERIHGLLRRCLRKDSRKRLPHIAMARFEIDEASIESPESRPVWLSSPAAKPAFVRRAMPVAIGIVLASGLTSAGWWSFRPQPSQPVVHRFAIPLLDGEEAATYPFRAVAISADGSQVVYAAHQRLNVRSMSDPVPSVVAGTDTGAPIGSPTFSPDGRSIAYISLRRGVVGGGATINTISVNGGVPTTVAQVRAGNVPGLSWSNEGILYSDIDEGIFRIAPNGGKPERLVALAAGEAIQGPVMLPGGRGILFTLATGREAGTASTLDLWDTGKIVVQPLPAGQRTTLIEGGSDPKYLPTGHLLYARGGTIYVAPFDVDRLKVGASSPVVQGVARVVGGRASTGAAQFSVSSTGSVIYVEGPASLPVDQPKLVMVDREGNIEPLDLPAQSYERPRVSRDGTKLAFGLTENSGPANILIYDLSGKTSPRPLTFEKKNRYPVWSPDSTRVAYQSDREGDLAIYTQVSDGSAAAERLTTPETGTAHMPESWSSDSKHLLYSVSKDGMYSLWVHSFDTKRELQFGDAQSSRLMSPTFSPHGDWVAYTTTSSDGQNLVWVEPFPATGAKYLVGVGARPQWSPNGNEIYFYRTDATFVESVETRGLRFNWGKPVAIPFNVYAGRGPGGGRDADIFPDGKRFVAVLTASDQRPSTNIRQFQVVLNWFEELRQRSPR